MKDRDKVLNDPIDASLARSFLVPDDPAAKLTHLFEEGPSEPGAVLPHGLRQGWWRPSLAAAAAVLFAYLVWHEERSKPLSPAVSEDVAELPMPVREPDLATLYYEISTALDDPFLCPTPEGLASKLADNYDCCNELRVHPNVTDLLEGPFDSAQWPSGTILSGKAGDSTAILIADLDSTYRCCVRPQMPEESELEVFTMRLGDLLLTEVTPLSEPRLLDYFAWGEELR